MFSLPRLPSAVGMLRSFLVAGVLHATTTEALSLNQHLNRAAHGTELAQTNSLEDLMKPSAAPDQDFTAKLAQLSDSLNHLAQLHAE